MTRPMPSLPITATRKERMHRTAEQLTAAKELTAAAPGYRVIADVEGWPLSPGKYGRLEHMGSGQLAAYTDSTNLFNRVIALPGVSRHQTGDAEYRVLVTPAAVPAVAKLLRCHRKRSGGAEHLAEHAYGGTFDAVEGLRVAK